MRVVFDLSSATQSDSRFRGIGRYAIGLTRSILEHAKASSHEVFISLSANRRESINEARDQLSDLVSPEHFVFHHVLDDIAQVDPANMWRLRASQVIRNAFHESLEPDCVVSFSNFEGYLEDAPTSVISERPDIVSASLFHDLIPLLNLEQYLGAEGPRSWYFDKLELLKQHDLLLCISDSALNEAETHLELPAGVAPNPIAEKEQN